METGNTRTLIVENATDQAVELLKKLIATPSVSRDEEAAADIIEQYLQNAGCTVERKGNNVWARSARFNNDKPAVLLNAHIDTVKPVASWTRQPFEPQRQGDTLYGLGANDCGGGLVTLLQVFRLMVDRPRAYNLIYMASAEEEVSGADGMRRALPLLPPISVAIVGEPTAMQPAIAEKGLMVIDGVAHGRAGHAARGEGVNAIYEVLDDLVFLRNYRFEKVSPLLGPTVMNVTVIHAGTQHNVVPDRCEFVIDVRTNEYYRNEDVFNFLQENTKSELTARSFHLHSSCIDAAHPLVRRCVDMGLKPFGSPTLSDQSLMPFPSFKLGPGDSARSHSADEFICISEIQQALQVYIDLLDGLPLS